MARARLAVCAAEPSACVIGVQALRIEGFRPGQGTIPLRLRLIRAPFGTPTAIDTVLVLFAVGVPPNTPRGYRITHQFRRLFLGRPHVLSSPDQNMPPGKESQGSAHLRQAGIRLS